MRMLALTLVPRLALGLVVALSSACGGSAAPGSKSTSHAAPITPQLQVQKPGALLGYQLVMNAKTLDGAPLASEKRAVALVVFASWCGHCKKELAELGQLRVKHPGLRIIGVNAYEDFQGISNRGKLNRYIADNAPWLTEIVSADSKMLADFGGIPKIPSLFLYDADGRVVEEYRRNKRPAPTPEELDAAITRATSGS